MPAKYLPLFDLRLLAKDNRRVNESNFNSKVCIRAASLCLAGLGLALSATVATVAQDKAAPGPLSASSRVRHWLEIGRASWYGHQFQGHRTATGEKFDMNALTCAHRTLPLGSWLRVTNLVNRKSIFVRVNDRGPVSDDRIVDLSFAAAKAVGLNGVGRVKLEPVSAASPELERALVAQLGVPALPPALAGR